MYIEFKTSKLRKCCESFDSGRQEWGDAITRKVVQRIAALKAALYIEELSPLPPLRCHALHGNREGQYAMDLGHPHRLVFELLNEPRQIDTEPGSLPETGVRILGVEDYHGKSRG